MSAPAIPVTDVQPRLREVAEIASPLDALAVVMRAFASLKLTVALFALGIFVVLVGTLAQQEANIGQVVPNYFHAWVMWVDVNLLFPKMFFPFMPRLPVPPFPAPGGMTIGTLMAINLLAAHGWRFTIQAKGMRLLLGLIVMLIGLAVGLLIIWSGHNGSGFQAKPPFSWNAFRTAFTVGSGLFWLVLAIAFGAFGVAPMVQKVGKSAIPFVELAILTLLGIPLVAAGLAIGYGFMSGNRPAHEAIRIVWQLMQGGLAGLILLVGCIMVFRKRGGMVLLHAGIGLLIFNELWVAMTARERQVFMQEGQTVDYLRDIRTVELAIVDRSAKETDEHVVVPRDLLLANYRANQAGGEAVYIDHKQLPVKIAVLKYFENADVEDLKPGEKSHATSGRGLQEKLVERRAGKGTDTDSKVDVPGAYVQIADKTSGKDLGTYLLSQFVDYQKTPERFGEKVAVGDKTYDVFLRFKREYKPYTMSLIDVRKDDYLASDTPRNYSSDVKISDPEVGVEESVHIKMNDPLRYRGDTFYQSGYQRLPDGEATTLAVVLNRGWMIPYVACMIVVIGMVAHFLISVTRFIGRREAEELAAGDVIRAEVAQTPTGRSKKKNARNAAGRPFNWSVVGLPALAAGLFVLMVGSALRQPEPKPQEMNYAAFGELPVAHLGRVKPLDTLARNALRALTINSESAKTVGGKRIPAVQWLLEVISGSDESLEMPIIRIDSKEVRRVFDLPDRAGFAYAVKELQPKIGDFERQVEAAHKTEEDQRSVEQRRILELDERLKLYIMLVRAFTPPPELPQIPSEEESKQNPGAIQRFIADYRAVMDRTTAAMTAMKAPRAILVVQEKDAKPEDAWQPYPLAYAKAALLTMIGQEGDAATIGFNGIVGAYRKGDAAAFDG